MPEPRDGESWRTVLTGDDGGHQWVAATYVLIETGNVVGTLDRKTTHVKLGAYAKVLDVICESCRGPAHMAWGKPCPGVKAPWLTGGPEHRRAPVAVPTYDRPPLSKRQLPTLPRETSIRNTLQGQVRPVAIPDRHLARRNGLDGTAGREKIASRLLADTEQYGSVDEMHPRVVHALSRAAFDQTLPAWLRSRLAARLLRLTDEARRVRHPVTS